MTSDSPAWLLVGVPLLIFVARVLDVGVGTIRIALVARGQRTWAPLAGFFESLIWLIAISQVVQHLDRPVHYLAWAGGYATGTWVGLLIEERLALGLLALRIITEEDASRLIERLGAEDFGVTTFAARGLRGNVRLLFSVIPRRDLERFLDEVRVDHPKAFVSISDVRTASEGFFPGARRRALWRKK